MAECIPFIHNRATNNETSSNEKKILDKNETMIVLLFVCACLVLTTNLALVVGLRKTNKKLTRSQKLYSYLSLTDSIVGLICLPYFAIINLLSINTCRSQSIGMAISAYSFGTVETNTLGKSIDLNRKAMQLAQTLL